MGLKITNSEEHVSGSVTTTYIHLSGVNKPKDADIVYVSFRCYTSKTRRTADINNVSRPKNMIYQDIPLPMNMPDFCVESNILADVYALLKTYLEDLGKTVVNDI